MTSSVCVKERVKGKTKERGGVEGTTLYSRSRPRIPAVIPQNTAYPSRGTAKTNVTSHRPTFRRHRRGRRESGARNGVTGATAAGRLRDTGGERERGGGRRDGKVIQSLSLSLLVTVGLRNKARKIPQKQNLDKITYGITFTWKTE